MYYRRDHTFDVKTSFQQKSIRIWRHCDVMSVICFLYFVEFSEVGKGKRVDVYLEVRKRRGHIFFEWNKCLWFIGWNLHLMWSSVNCRHTVMHIRTISFLLPPDWDGWPLNSHHIFINHIKFPLLRTGARCTRKKIYYIIL